MDIFKEFPEEARKRAADIANAVTSHIEFESWTPEQMNKMWRGRSYAQILESRKVNVCVPCIDTATIGAVELDRYFVGELVLMIERGAAEAFVRGEKRKLHLDAATSFKVKGEEYLIDIGAGDITLMKPVHVSGEEKTLLTTRYNEPKWKRTEIGRLSGRSIGYNNALDLLLRKRQTPLPFGLTREHFFQYNSDANDGDEFYTHAEGYNAERMRAWNEGWTEGVQHIFPGLEPFNFAD